ncbi:MAG: MATE family efflux transporter [Clostridiales bacterium]|nr:MATE family efflux transporter [Clostridiales bacterium]
MNVFHGLLAVRNDKGQILDPENTKNIYRKTLSIAWPSTVEGALMSIIGSVDTMMVGMLGSAAIAAVGLTAQPRMIMLILAQALCIGTTALCARRKGAQDQRGANSCLNQSLTIITVLGVMMTLLGYFGAEWLVTLGGANADTLEMSTTYFRIISLAFLPVCWQLCICAAMRAIGKTRITMATNITANLINVFLNYCLIGGNLGFPALGVKGAAIATAVGSISASLICIFVVLRKKGYFHLALPRFDKVTISGLTKVGSSSMLESVCLRMGFLILARLVAGIGTAAFAAYQIVSQVTSLSFTLGDGVSAASTSLVGQSLGAKRKDLAMAHARAGYRIGLAAALMLMTVIFIFRRQIALLFTDEEQIIAGVTASLYVVIASMIFQNGRVVLSGALRGAGDVKFVAVCALLSVTILRPAFTWLFCYPVAGWLPQFPNVAVMGPWIAFLIDSIVRDRLLSHRIKQGKWLNIKLE